MTAELDIDSLYREQGAFIARVIERLTGAGPHVDDLLQETFIIAHNKRAQYDPERAAASTWLYGIAANLCRGHRRSLGRYLRFGARLSQEPEPAPPEQPDVIAQRTQAAGIVTQIMARLPDRQREVFALYELEGLEGADIAELLDIPVATVWTRLHHARKAFKKSARRVVGQEVRS